MRRTAVGLLVVAALLTAGCGGPAPAGSPAAPSTTARSAPPPVDAMTAEAVRLRTDEVVGGQVQVRITATEPFTVTAVALDSPGFEELPARPVTAAFAPGRVIDLPTPVGAPLCEVAPEPAAARVSVTWPGGRAEELRVPLAAEVLALIHDEECAVLALSRVVDVSVTGLAEHGDALTGDLVVERRGGDDPVRVVRLDRSVLVEPSAELPLDLAANRRAASTPVSFAPASCDPHVLAETKKPYVFALEVHVGGRAPVVLDLPLDDAARGALDALVHRVCGAR